jgi:hypothetical protein
MVNDTQNFNIDVTCTLSFVFQQEYLRRIYDAHCAFKLDIEVGPLLN